MSGKKIEQVAGGLEVRARTTCSEGDLFNIIAYDSEIESLPARIAAIQRQDPQGGPGLRRGIYAGGSTNIDGALRTAPGPVAGRQRRRPISSSSPTACPPPAKPTRQKIVANAKEDNKVHARIFAFGVGYDVNARFLDKLARESFGQSEYVRPNEDIEDRISRLYRRIESPVLTGVQIEFALDEKAGEEGKPVNRVYPKARSTCSPASNWSSWAATSTPGAAKVTSAARSDGKQQKFDFPAELGREEPRRIRCFIEKLWAVRRVGEILDEFDLQGSNEELIKELVDLSTRHGILTPYTSFMADENTQLGDVTANMRRAAGNLLALDQVSGYGGVQQRAYKGVMQRANQPLAGYGGHAGFDAEPRSSVTSARKPQAMAGSTASVAAVASPVAAGPAGAPAVTGSFEVFGRQTQTASAQRGEETVRNVGNRAFYRRGGQWIDSQLSEAQQSQAKRIKQFSDAYFELARRNGRQLAQYMVFDEPVVLNVEGQAYLIEP